MSKLPPLHGGRPTNKIGPVSTNRTVAQTATPSDTTGSGETQSSYDTYFTKVPVDGEPTEIIYNGDRMWAKVTLTLETAGPVAVGNLSQIAPVLSGKGTLLETDVETVFYIAKGTRLYVAAAGINRVKRAVEPIPWLETITGALGGLVSGARAAAAGAVAAAPAATVGSKL